MCHKRDSLDKCVHVSLKILDPGIQVVAVIPSLEGGDTQDKDMKGEIPAGAVDSVSVLFCRISYTFLGERSSYL